MDYSFDTERIMRPPSAADAAQRHPGAWAPVASRKGSLCLAAFTRQLQTIFPNSATIVRLAIVPSVYYYGSLSNEPG